MTKTELIQALSDATGSDRKSSKMFLEGLTGVVEKQIRRGGEVPDEGPRQVQGRQAQGADGSYPATGEAIKIPAKTVVRFTVAKALKDIIKKK
jgi:DNA-binding protein HU-beta